MYKNKNTECCCTNYSVCNQSKQTHNDCYESTINLPLRMVWLAYKIILRCEKYALCVMSTPSFGMKRKIVLQILHIFFFLQSDFLSVFATKLCPIVCCFYIFLIYVYFSLVHLIRWFFASPLGKRKSVFVGQITCEIIYDQTHLHRNDVHFVFARKVFSACNVCFLFRKSSSYSIPLTGTIK